VGILSDDVLSADNCMIREKMGNMVIVAHNLCYNTHEHINQSVGDVKMKKIYLTTACILVLTIISVYGCSPTKTVYVPAPTSERIPPTISTIPTIPTPTYSPPASTTFPVPSNLVIRAQSFESLQANGLYVQAGKTLTLSWSADGNLDGFIFTANQFSNWKNSAYSGNYTSHGYGSQQTIQVTIQNSDTYYAVLLNNAFSVLGSGPTVEVYQATLIEN
jgi:hypothetical protein